MSGKIKVLFICLGNICRSPMAENVFRQLVKEAGLGDQIEVDSAGTAGYHIGDMPHPGTRSILTQYGIPCTGKSRQVNKIDFSIGEFKQIWVIGMDQSNMKNLERLIGSHPTMHLLLEFADEEMLTDDLNVPDPYYTGDFETVFQLIKSGSEGLLKEIIQRSRLI